MDQGQRSAPSRSRRSRIPSAALLDVATDEELIFVRRRRQSAATSGTAPYISVGPFSHRVAALQVGLALAGEMAEVQNYHSGHGLTRCRGGRANAPIELENDVLAVAVHGVPNALVVELAGRGI